MKRTTTYMLCAIIAECFIIYTSVLVKVVDMSPINVGLYRITLAIPLFFFMAQYHKNIFTLPVKDIGFMLLAGVFFGFDLVFFNLALHHTTVANVNLFASLACFILMPIGMLLFNERWKKSALLGAVVAFFGILVLMGGKSEFSVATPYGDFLAFLSVLCYSCFLTAIYALRKNYDTLEIMFFACVGSTMVLAVMVWLFEGFEIPRNLKEWGILVLIAFCGQIVGQGFFNFILGKLDSQTSSLLLLFSPIIAAIMGFCILGEQLGVFEILGIGIIMFGVYLAKKDAY